MTMVLDAPPSAEMMDDVRGSMNSLSERLDNIEHNSEMSWAVGMIMLWFGDGSSPPYGWAVCDGSNGTPDMRGRVPVGVKAADTDFDTLGETGGGKSISIGADSHQHTIDHGHSGGSHHHSGSAHTHDLAHGHTASSGTPNSTTAADPIAGAAASTTHSHTITVNNASGNTGSGGGSDTGDSSVTIATSSGLVTGVGGGSGSTPSIMNPYLALHFIMRILP